MARTYSCHGQTNCAFSATTVTLLGRISRRMTGRSCTPTTSSALPQSLGIQLTSHIHANVISFQGNSILVSDFLCRVSLRRPPYPSIRAQASIMGLGIDPPTGLSTPVFGHRAHCQQYEGNLRMQTGRNFQ